MTDPSSGPASRPVTTAEVARLAGVSTKTVSRVLNNSPLLSDRTRARVEAIIAQTGFVPNPQARALALRRNFLIALVHSGADRAVLEAVEQGMFDAMRGGEFALVLQPVDPAVPDQLRQFLGRHRPAGVVLLPPLSGSEEHAAICRQAGYGLARLGHARQPAGIAANDRAAMASAVDWLVSLGHRRIGLICGPESSLTAQQREMGYLDSMADHGLDRGASLIAPGDGSFASGADAGMLLLSVSPRPTAIIAASDAMAAGLMQAAGRAAIAVPDQLSVVGFDDTPLAAMTVPPLTSMAIPWREMGFTAAEHLQSSEEEIASHPAFPFEGTLILRESVRDIAAHAATRGAAFPQSG